MYCIYYIKNKITNQYYIGQTHNFEERIKCHIKASKRPDSRLSYSINRYGIENFEYNIIHNNISTKEETCELERYYISKYNSFLDGYNTTHGGEHNQTGIKRTDEQKRYISECTKKAMSKPDIRERFIKGLKQSYENGREPWNKGVKTGPNPKISEAKKGKKQQRHIPADELFKICSERSKKVNSDRHWFTNGYEDVRINSIEIDKYISMGYIKGRSKANGKNKKHVRKNVR